MAFDRSAIKDQAIIVNGKAVKVANATDEQLRAAAVKDPSILAAGWYVDGGKLYKRSTPAPAAPAPAAPAAPSTPAPDPRGPAFNTPPTPPSPPDPRGPAFNTPPTGYTGPLYFKVRQKQADGSWKVVTLHYSKLTQEQRNAALKNGLNGPVPGAGGGGGGSKPAAPTTPGPAAPTPGAPAPGTSAPAAGTPAPSWIPPQIGIGYLTTDPASGRIDWQKLLSAAHEVAAVDPQYAQDLSTNIFQTMQSVAPLQAEITSLTAVNPATGKTLYQSLFENADRQWRQANSKTFGTAAARGIGSSGMVNANLATNAIGKANAITDASGKYGDARIAELLRGMTDQLQAQDNNFSSSYYSALSRAKGNIPSIPGVK